MGSLRKLSRWWRGRRHARRQRVRTAVVAETGGVVQAGPFAGLAYPSPEAAGSELAPKLIGSYEREIHGFVEAALQRSPTRVVNVGGGEGYYAVGLALRLPETEVHVFEGDEAGRSLCAALAEVNGVSDRVLVHGFCRPEDLERLTSEPALVVCDVEGAERELLDPQAVPGLRGCEIIAELHSIDGFDTVREITSRFRPTHHVKIVRFHRRPARAASHLTTLSRVERRVGMDERRRRGLTWIHLIPRGRSRAESRLPPEAT